MLDGDAIATGLPKNLASCTSVESSSPGIGASLGGLIFLTRLRTVLRSLWAPGEEDWDGIVGVGWSGFLFAVRRGGVGGLG